MSNIVIKHIFETEQILLSFDMQDGSLSFPSINLDIKSDIDLNSLLIKLTEFVEIKRELEIQFEDPNSLLKSDAKIKLIGETLEEIYAKFNEKIKIEEVSDAYSSTEADVSDDNGDLPF
ncbi:hypothetical protein [Pedobacter jamesrossensis]|uniref:Uncharacterized protein n=1 Tax=Pedobacter jamesrossensis TaxID=1908238 RepID=A0ABV8NI74_9SPHI